MEANGMTPEQIAEHLVQTWQGANKMPPLAWDFRGFAAEAARLAITDWTSAETPPEMKKSEWWPESEPVLVCEADGTMRVATYEQVDDDSTPCWYSADSERWTLEKVTHWMPLPLPPTPAMRRRPRGGRVD